MCQFISIIPYRFGKTTKSSIHRANHFSLSPHAICGKKRSVSAANALSVRFSMLSNVFRRVFMRVLYTFQHYPLSVAWKYGMLNVWARHRPAAPRQRSRSTGRNHTTCRPLCPALRAGPLNEKAAAPARRHAASVLGLHVRHILHICAQSHVCPTPKKERKHLAFSTEKDRRCRRHHGSAAVFRRGRIAPGGTNRLQSGRIRLQNGRLQCTRHL